MFKYWMVGVVAVVLAACSNDDTGGTVFHEAEQDGAGMCPTTPTILTGSASEGAACTDGTDCAPTCCSCSSGGNSWLAAECLDGECKAANACADTAKTTFCD